MTNLGRGKLAKFKQPGLHRPKLILAEVGWCDESHTRAATGQWGLCHCHLGHCWATAGHCWATAGHCWASAGRSRLGGLNPPQTPGSAAGREQTPLVGLGFGGPVWGAAAAGTAGPAALWVRLAPAHTDKGSPFIS